MTSPQKVTNLIVTKFHMEPPGVEETKICSNRPSHMTMMATKLKYG